MRMTSSQAATFNTSKNTLAKTGQLDATAKSVADFNTPKNSANLDIHLNYAHQQLQAKGYKGYYNAIVNACLSQVYPTLSFNQFKRNTNRATAPLTSTATCVMYSALYGMNHFDRFFHTLEQVMGTHKRTECKSKTLHVNDYGCGQALASLALLSYIERYVPTQGMTLHFHLIEPSASAIEQGEALIQSFATRIEASIHIHRHCMTLEAYLATRPSQKQQATQSSNDETVPFNLHLFSNIVDIAAVQSSIDDLVEHTCSLPGKQLLIAVGPNFSNTTRGLQVLQAAHRNNPRALRAIQGFETQSEYYSLQEHHWRVSSVQGAHLALAYSNPCSEASSESKVA